MAHAWSDEDERLTRAGFYNARDGRGWQPMVSTLSVEDSTARDAAAKEEQAAHWKGVITGLRERADALERSLP